MTKIQCVELIGHKLAGEGSTDLGYIDWIEGDELIDVSVGPLEEGLDMAQIYRGKGMDLRSSRAISGFRKRGNLRDPPTTSGVDLRFDDNRHICRGLHLGHTLYRLHMARAPPSSPRCAPSQWPRQLKP
jgi:hypothetical protein